MERLSSRIERTCYPVIRIAILVGGGVVLCIPFWWMIVTAFDNAANVTVRIPPSLLFHKGYTGVLNFENTFHTIPILRYYLNSLLITLSVIALQTLSCSMAGYAFAKGRFPGKSKLFILFLATMMIPFQLYMVPLYLIMNTMGFVNTPLAVILPAIHSAYGVFLMSQYIRTLPESILEAARMEGAGECRIFFTIILPLSKPVLATLTVLTALACWNDFLWPYLVLLKQSQYTITVGVSSFQQQNAVAVGNVVVVSLLAIAPVVVLYLFLQRFIISGITMGATKH